MTAPCTGICQQETFSLLSLSLCLKEDPMEWAPQCPPTQECVKTSSNLVWFLYVLILWAVHLELKCNANLHLPTICCASLRHSSLLYGSLYLNMFITFQVHFLLFLVATFPFSQHYSEHIFVWLHLFLNLTYLSLKTRHLIDWCPTLWLLNITFWPKLKSNIICTCCKSKLLCMVRNQCTKASDGSPNEQRHAGKICEPMKGRATHN